MSLQSNISAWQLAYDNAGITAGGGDPNYIGSVCATNGSFYQGANIYQTGTYQIHEFNWYSGQGVPSGGSSGGKFLVGSNNGFSWNTVDANSNGALEFVTSGSLNTLYLGTSADNSASPECATLTAFDVNSPLLVVNGFNVAVDDVAFDVFGVANGNTAIPVDSSVATPSLFTNLMSNPQYYESATLNSAILYDLAFEDNAHSQQAFEFVLDQYLLGLSGNTVNLSSSWAAIDGVLASTGVDIDYYEFADEYVADGVIPTDCGCSATAGVDSDLLLAA